MGRIADQGYVQGEDFHVFSRCAGVEDHHPVGGTDATLAQRHLHSRHAGRGFRADRDPFRGDGAKALIELDGVMKEMLGTPSRR